jgi:hypothetical protein
LASTARADILLTGARAVYLLGIALQDENFDEGSDYVGDVGAGSSNMVFREISTPCRSKIFSCRCNGR